MALDLSFDPSAWGGDELTDEFSLFITSQNSDELQGAFVVERRTSTSTPLEQEPLDLTDGPTGPTAVGVDTSSAYSYDSFMLQDAASLGKSSEPAMTPSDLYNPLSPIVGDPQPQPGAHGLTSIASLPTGLNDSLRTFPTPVMVQGKKRANAESCKPDRPDFGSQALVQAIPPKTKKARMNHGDALPGRFCFRLNSDAPTTQQYAKYSNSRLKEIQKLRDLGACFRCKLLKKQVILGK
jgi:hypothetical protein